MLDANYVKLRGKLKGDIENEFPIFMNGGDIKNVNQILQIQYPNSFCF